jgi:hypothetical protein
MNMIPEDTMPPDLRARLLRLRETVATMQPPADIEARLKARLFDVAGQHPAPRPLVPRRGPTWIDRWGAWVAWPISVTAAAGVVSWMVYTNPAIAPEQMGPATASFEVAGPPPAATPFIALTSLDIIPGGAHSELVSATLPRATLAEFGLPVSPMRAAEPIDAEFLVGENGGVLAVRFVDSAGR